MKYKVLIENIQLLLLLFCKVLYEMYRRFDAIYIKYTSIPST